MSDGEASEERDTVSPSEAFDIVGDETRLEILRVLGEAEGPMAFSELFDRVTYDDTGNFSYHLRQLEGPFLKKTDEGYALLRAGARIVEAILSGAVTETPTLDRQPAKRPCFLCGGAMELSYHQESVRLYCPDCGGTRGPESETAERHLAPDSDIVGGISLPPAGVQGREPSDVIRAAEIWSVSSIQARSRDVCPRCSGHLKRSVRVCEEHDSSRGHCAACDQRFAVTVVTDCRTCIFGVKAVFTSYLLGKPPLMEFLLDHGIDPIQPRAAHLTTLSEEAVLSNDPFEARFTFTADDEEITLWVDDDLDVVDVDRSVVESQPHK